MRIKICGITKPEQGSAIATLGATALGFICVPNTPRYISPAQIQAVVAQLPTQVDKIGVFANASREEITHIVHNSGLTGVQLHGDESPEYCQQLRATAPNIEIIKAFRIRNTKDLDRTTTYTSHVDVLLLDAYHPQQLGGTGKTLNWTTLKQFSPTRPWFLAGGLTPDNILTALSQVNPNGIDLSSSLENTPGNKDLTKVAKLFEQLSSKC